MRFALPGSVLCHAGLLALVLVGVSWQQPDDDAPAPAPVSVSIIAVSSVSANETEVLDSDATLSSVSSGSEVEQLEPVEAEPAEEVVETVEPVVPDTLAEIAPESTEIVEPERVSTEDVRPVEQEVVEAFEPEEAVVAEAAQDAELVTSAVEAPLAALAAKPMAALEPEMLETETLTPLEPVEVAEIDPAPMPVTASFTRQSEPIVHKPRPQQTTHRPQQQPQQQRGNGGNSSADSVAASGTPTSQTASNGNGGAAAEARYQSQVTRKVRNALRTLRGQAGLVVVAFTVHANGQVSGIRIANSSGDAAIDQAGIDAVNRAAPFPPFPAEVSRTSWQFGVPLEYRR